MYILELFILGMSWYGKKRKGISHLSKDEICLEWFDINKPSHIRKIVTLNYWEHQQICEKNQPIKGRIWYNVRYYISNWNIYLPNQEFVCITGQTSYIEVFLCRGFELQNRWAILSCFIVVILYYGTEELYWVVSLWWFCRTVRICWTSRCSRSTPRNGRTTSSPVASWTESAHT